MTAKDKRFPLSLSSVVNQKDKTSSGTNRPTIMPQTAMRNAAHHMNGVAAAKLAKSQELHLPQGAVSGSLSAG